MKITVALASSFDEWAWGYGRAFELFGWSALCLGPIHVNFECDSDQYLALETPWTAVAHWLRQRLAGYLDKIAITSGRTTTPIQNL